MTANAPNRALNRALTEPGDPPIAPLPADVERLLIELNAPPRLAAHLRAVHDVAGELITWIRNTYPAADVDPAAVLFGAATHDIGKIRHPGELSDPGAEHEEAGYRLLLEHGIEERFARFARTHAAWTGDDIGLDDLLVSLADKTWKAKRVHELEQLVVDHLADGSGREPWQVFMDLDDELTLIAAGADSRLEFQNRHPIEP